MERWPLLIIGAGPAGLTAAYEAVQRGISPFVAEKADKVGGLARTEVHQGYRFDIGGHRFYTKYEEIQALWQHALGSDFLEIPRLSRIYYQGQFFNYPLDLGNTLGNLGFTESLQIVVSYLKARIRPYPREDTFEQWVSNRFGSRLYETFFQSYTEKVWGMPCNEIQAEWAAQRIMGLSLTSAISNALFDTNHTKSLIGKFHYPRLGPGMMWRRLCELVENQGGQVWLDSEVVRLERDNGRIAAALLQSHGEQRKIVADNYVSSMPVPELMARMVPLPPDEVMEACRQLRYRAFILVGLIVDGAELFPDNWIYVHSPDVSVGRVQNFKNWSMEMVPDPAKSSLGMEYFCTEGDELWRLPDVELIKLATRELAELGLAKGAPVETGIVIRQPHAYPVYDDKYRAHLEVIRRFLAGLDNLQTVGRNGMHRYNNQDHSMLTGMLAIRNLTGEAHDLWAVN